MKTWLALLRTGWQLEWRQQQGSATGGVFVTAASFAIYLSLQATQKGAQLAPTEWNLLFWVLFLFMSLYVGGSVGHISRGRVLFYFLLADPLVLWAARALHMFGLLCALGGLAYGLQALWIGNPVVLGFRFAGVLALGAAGFATLLTTLSLMVARAEAPGLLFAVLGLPLLVPLCVLCLKATQGCLAHVAQTEADHSLWPLVGFVLLLLSLVLLLFPYIWKS